MSESTQGHEMEAGQIKKTAREIRKELRKNARRLEKLPLAQAKPKLLRDASAVEERRIVETVQTRLHEIEQIGQKLKSSLSEIETQLEQLSHLKKLKKQARKAAEKAERAAKKLAKNQAS